MNIILLGANNPETIRVINAIKRSIPNFKVIGFIDNDPQKKGKDFFGYPILGGSDWLEKEDITDIFFVNLITRDAVTRFSTTKKLQELGAKFTNLIHPSVNLEMVELDLGIYIQENVVVQAGVKMGFNSSIHIGSLIGHETSIGSHTFIAHGCNISGCVKIGNGVFIGTGASVIPRVTIGDWSIIGAGTTVIKDVPPFSVVVGNPGKVIKTIDEKTIEQIKSLNGM